MHLQSWNGGTDLPERLSDQDRLPLEPSGQEVEHDSKGSRKDLLNLLGGISSHAKKLKQLLADPDDPALLVVTEIDKVKELISEIGSTGQLDKIRETEQALIRHTVDDLPITLKQFCDERGVELWGAAPDFIIDGIVYLGVDFTTGSVTLNDQKLHLFPFKKVLQHLVEELDRYKKEAFDPPKFLNLLWKAYEAKADENQRSNSMRKRIAIFDLLLTLALQEQGTAFSRNPVKERFKSYSQHRFRANLFLLLVSGADLTLKGRRLILEPTSVADEGLFMYLPATGRCGFVGHLLFSPVE